MKDGAIVMTDINAHSDSWYSGDTTDHRGRVIEDIIAQSDTMITNEDCPTRIPFNRGANTAQPTAPDLTIVPLDLAIHTKWETLTQLSSDHLPIRVNVNSSSSTGKQKRRTFINYKKLSGKSSNNLLRTKWIIMKKPKISTK